MLRELNPLDKGILIVQGALVLKSHRRCGWRLGFRANLVVMDSELMPITLELTKIVPVARANEDHE